MQRQKLGETLSKAGIIPPEQLHEALRRQREKEGFLGQILVEMGWSTEEEVCRAVSASLRIDFVQIEDSVTISQEIIQLAPESLATQRKVLPLFTQDNTLYLAMENPLDYDVIRRIETCTGMHVSPLIAPASTVRNLIERHYDPEKYLGGILENIEAFGEIPQTERGNGKQIGRLAKLIISTGIKQQAGEIHLEPAANRLRVQYKSNGASLRGITIPKWLQSPLVNNVKQLAGQSGQFRATYQDNKIDLQMTVLPTDFGEKIVIRILATEQPQETCEECGEILKTEWHICPFCGTEKAPKAVSTHENKPAAIRIVAADDEAQVRDLVRALLEQAGYEIISAVDGDDALEKIQTELPDLVILDVVMPNRDGFSTCKAIRSSVETMFLPVIMLTAQDSIEEKLTGLKAGADDYITKPFNSKELLARIEIVLRRASQ